MQSMQQRLVLIIACRLEEELIAFVDRVAMILLLCYVLLLEMMSSTPTSFIMSVMGAYGIKGNGLVIELC